MSTVKTSNLQNASASNPNIVLNSDGTIGGDCLTQTCRAWVNFDGTGTPSIRGQYNVSSITDNGTGDYTVSFTTALADANYSVVAVGMRNATYVGDANTIIVGLKSNTTYGNNVSTSSFSVTTHLPSTAANVDPLAVCIAVFR